MKKQAQTLAIVAVLLFVLWNLFSFFFGRNSTEMVQNGVLEDSFGVRAYVFKDETIVSGTADGVLQPTVAGGERVAKGARIGAMLSADTDEGALHEYLRIGDRIERLSKEEVGEAYAETVRTDEQITSLSARIIRAAAAGNMEKAAQLKEELLIAKDAKSAAKGQSGALIQELEARRAALKGRIGNSVKEVYSPVAGTLYLECDGLEESMSLSAAENLTPESLTALVEKSADGGGCKIMHNDRWRAACIIDAAQAQGLKEGQAVSLRFHDQGGETEKATIAEISDESDGQCVLVLSGTRAPEGFLQCRRASLDVILSRHEGLRVPKDALAEENGETGVYVQTITKRTFKKVEVLCIGEEYAIIREGENTALRLYDTVLY